MDKMIKKYLLLIIVFILFKPLMAIEFYDLSFDEAIKLAKKENKLIFLMVEEKYCPWCRKMKASTLKDKEVMEILNSDYISISIYKNSSDLKRKFRVRFVPTIFVLDPKKEEELSRILGYISADSLYDRLFVISRW